MKCFTVTVGRGREQCSFVPGAHILLYPGIGFGTEFIFQPGYHQGGYVDNTLCKWNISPKSSCHKTAILMIHKDLHAAIPKSGINCPAKDHVHIQYSDNQFDYYCGDSTADNCPIDNCPSQNFIQSDGGITITFRSDASGKSTGFLAMVISDIEDEGCTKKRRAFKPVAVPPTPRCRYYTASRARYTPCECSGTCTISSQNLERDRASLVRVVKSMINRNSLLARTNSYKYVNSPNKILRGASRRVAFNIKEFGSAISTTSKQLDYQLNKLEQYRKVETYLKVNPQTCPNVNRYLVSPTARLR
jgi:hypothetical protein